MSANTSLSKKKRPKKKVLVVDDDNTIRAMIYEILIRQNFTVAGAKSQEEAMDFLFPRDRGMAMAHTYDLVFLDIALGRGNGLRLLKDVRAKGMNTPVIMISGSAESSLVQQAVELSVQGYIVKPFTVEAILTKIAAIFPDEEIENY